MKREGYTITDRADIYYFAHKKWSSRAGNKITRIIPHHMAGNLTPAQFMNIMKSSRQMSPTVAVFTDGTVYAFVPEEMRCWCSGSWEADKNSLCLEIANDGGASTGWHVSDKAYQEAIKIMAEWCKRYNIEPKYSVRGNGINMHKDWSATACPGDYLTKKITSGQMERDIRNAMNPRDKTKIQSFVKLLYKNVLKVSADKDVLTYWTNELYNGGANAKIVTRAFFNSPDYLKKKTSDEQFIKDIYLGYLERKEDAVGFKYWLQQLKSGSSRNSVMQSFEEGVEFEKRKKKYTL